MDPGWQRVGRRIAEQRTYYGWTAQDLADRAHVGLRTIQSLEAGEPKQYRPATIEPVQAALEWDAGSIELIREGQEPIPLPDPAMDRIRRAWPNLTPNYRALIATIVETLGGQQ